jgi:hypothetical protein
LYIPQLYDFLALQHSLLAEETPVKEELRKENALEELNPRIINSKEIVPNNDTFMMAAA